MIYLALAQIRFPDAIVGWAGFVGSKLLLLTFPPIAHPAIADLPVHSFNGGGILDL